MGFDHTSANGTLARRFVVFLATLWCRAGTLVLLAVLGLYRPHIVECTTINMRLRIQSIKHHQSYAASAIRGVCNHKPLTFFVCLQHGVD